MATQPWEVPDELWVRLEPLIPKKPRRFRYPGRRPLDDRKVLSGILFVLTTGVGWERLPKELGFGSGDDLLATLDRLAGCGCLAASARRAAGGVARRR